MVVKNSYFQLDVKQGDGTYLIFYPPTESGERLTFEEVAEYLRSKKMEEYNAKELFDILNDSTEIASIKVSSEFRFEVNETLIVKVSKDRMTAVARFYAPSTNGNSMTKEEIIKDLESQRIQFGIDQKSLHDFVNQREYCKDIVIAKGMEPVHGEDARIEYSFKTGTDAKPKVNEDGTVNYYDLDIVNNVSAGQVLAQMTLEVPGKAGVDVLGNKIEPKVPKKAQFKYGKNISLSEDKLQIISDINGHVNIIEDKVFVSELYDVPADVDVSTGNIEYNGNVHIKGNVKTGYIVIAKGNVIVEGVVEGAQIIAGGQIIIQQGVLGMSKGILRAQGNVISKFLENCTVYAGGFVESDSIIHSKVYANTEVNVSGKKGFVTGGSVHAGNLVSAKTIGSTMGTETLIQVGIDIEKKERYDFLQKEMIKVKKSIDQSKPVIVAFGKKMGMGEKFLPEKITQINMLAKALKEMEQQLKDYQDEYLKMTLGFQECTHARIKVKGAIYPGVKLVISDSVYYVKEVREFSQFYREDGEVKRVSL